MFIRGWLSFFFILFIYPALWVSGYSASACPASSNFRRGEDGSNQPVYIWQDKANPPRAIVLAVHGLTMHGGVYEVLADNLVKSGFLVAAPDLRGYGRWALTATTKIKAEADYDKSYEDLVSLGRSLKAQYPGLPLFVVGESLGADLAIELAATEKNLVDGLVLSSPAVKHHNFCGSLLLETPAFLRNPARQIDLTPYIRRFASNDQRITQGALADPLVRKTLSPWELLRSTQAMKRTLAYADKIPPTVPVLIIQGSADRVVRSNAVVKLLAHLPSKDQTVRWFTNRGHLLLETAYIYPDTMQIVSGWLKEHAGEQTTAQTIIDHEDKIAAYAAP